MWQQTYNPHGLPVFISAIVAAVPILILLVLLGVARKPSWVASLAGLAGALVIATAWYGMPVGLALNSLTYGAGFGLFPIGWIVFWAILLYKVTVESGQFEIIKDHVGSLTPDHRLQAILIAFAFGAFIEGAAGFGTPVAVAAAMLTGLGFPPLYAAAICLLANTAPVAFGSIGIPVITLHGTTGLPLAALSSNVGRICAPVSLFVPAYLIVVMSGVRGLRGVIPAVFASGVVFAGAQILVSNLLGPSLTDIIGSLSAMLALILLLRFWQPAQTFRMASDTLTGSPRQHRAGKIALAWTPYGLLVVFVLLWGLSAVKSRLDVATIMIPWPGLDKVVIRTTPLVKTNSPYPAVYTLNFLTASGTACLCAVLASVLALRMPFAQFLRVFAATARQLALPLVTIASVLALAFVMNYSGATTSLGIAFAASGALFPFFSPILGWLGVFLTGSDTSSNALFGNLQVVTANALGLKPAFMAAANSSGGVMGKMISLQSIAVAAAATHMPSADEPRLFRSTLRHSIILVTIMGIICVCYAYVVPNWIK